MAWALMNVGEHRVELTLEHRGTFACRPDTVDLYANDYVRATDIVEGTHCAERAAATVAELPRLVVCA